MIRTRAIIKNLSYDKLVMEGIIPDLLPLSSQSPTTIATKRYPPFVYSNKNEDKFSFFGMLLDYVIRAGLRVNLTRKIDLGTDPNAEFIQTLPDKEMLEMMTHLSTY